MIALLLAPFIGVLFMFVFFVVISFLSSIYPSFGFMVFPVFIATNAMMILGGIVRSRSK